jgi:glycosyltransferase involved in cell wall biosynthesis
MNILLVTETYLPFIAGVSTSSDSIARFMALQGHTVTVVSPEPIIKGTVQPQERLTLVRTVSNPDPLYAGKAMTMFPFALPVINKLLDSQKFDIVHVQEPGSLGICAIISAKKHKVPLVGALHFTPEQVARMIPGKLYWPIVPITESYIRFIYSKYQAIMVPTQTFVTYLDSIGVKTPKVVVSNGVDTEKYIVAQKDMETRRSYKIPDDAFVFFFLGRLDKDKNVGTLVDALQYANKNVWLLIAGNGKQEPFLKAQAKTLGVENRIVWVSTVNEKQMLALYHAVDCFSIMSPYEVQSIVTLQGIASGLPVIAARAGALPELCHDGENGFLADTYDGKMVAQKMDMLASDPELCKKFGAKSREMSLIHHKPTALARLEALYKTLL